MKAAVFVFSKTFCCWHPVTINHQGWCGGGARYKMAKTVLSFTVSLRRAVVHSCASVNTCFDETTGRLIIRLHSSCEFPTPKCKSLARHFWFGCGRCIQTSISIYGWIAQYSNLAIDLKAQNDSLPRAPGWLLGQGTTKWTIATELLIVIYLPFHAGSITRTKKNSHQAQTKFGRREGACRQEERRHCHQQQGPSH
jgi:hypothetical protein